MDLDNFFSKVEKTDSCWLWKGYRNRHGYGSFSYKGKHWRAHRWIYTHVVGPIPTGLLVCHRCDSPPCVNPAHLFLGTSRDNNLDMISKGRARRADRRGSKGASAKLTEAQVQEIRGFLAQGVPGYRLAKQYGVSRGAIWFIQHGVTWRNVQE